MSAEDSRAGNRLLAAPSPGDWELVGPHLEETTSSLLDVLIEPGVAITHPFFPLSGLVSVLAEAQNGRFIEVGMYGREGAGPVAAFLGDVQTPNKHIVQSAGGLLRLDRAAVGSLQTKSPGFRSLLMRFVDVFTVQVGPSRVGVPT